MKNLSFYLLILLSSLSLVAPTTKGSHQNKGKIPAGEAMLSTPTITKDNKFKKFLAQVALSFFIAFLLPQGSILQSIWLVCTLPSLLNSVLYLVFESIKEKIERLRNPIIDWGRYFLSIIPVSFPLFTVLLFFYSPFTFITYFPTNFLWTIMKFIIHMPLALNMNLSTRICLWLSIGLLTYELVCFCISSSFLLSSVKRLTLLSIRGFFLISLSSYFFPGLEKNTRIVLNIILIMTSSLIPHSFLWRHVLNILKSSLKILNEKGVDSDKNEVPKEAGSKENLNPQKASTMVYSLLAAPCTLFSAFLLWLSSRVQIKKYLADTIP